MTACARVACNNDAIYRVSFSNGNSFDYCHADTLVNMKLGRFLKITTTLPIRKHQAAVKAELQGCRLLERGG